MYYCSQCLGREMQPERNAFRKHLASSPTEFKCRKVYKGSLIDYMDSRPRASMPQRSHEASVPKGTQEFLD